MTDPTLPELPDIPPTLRTDGTWRRKKFHGNPIAGYPNVYGWILKLGRYTTAEEKAWLRTHGFKFSGGTWKREDPAEVVSSTHT